MSSYFGYTEEYVLDKTPFWLNRKFEQADRERYDERIGIAQGVSRGVSLVVDMIFNKGKGAEDILPSYEQMKKLLESDSKEEKQSEFKKEIWWKPEA